MNGSFDNVSWGYMGHAVNITLVNIIEKLN